MTQKTKTKRCKNCANYLVIGTFCKKVKAKLYMHQEHEETNGKYCPLFEKIEEQETLDEFLEELEEIDDLEELDDLEDLPEIDEEE